MLPYQASVSKLSAEEWPQGLSGMPDTSSVTGGDLSGQSSCGGERTQDMSSGHLPLTLGLLAPSLGLTVRSRCLQSQPGEADFMMLGTEIHFVPQESLRVHSGGCRL